MAQAIAAFRIAGGLAAFLSAAVVFRMWLQVRSAPRSFWFFATSATTAVFAIAVLWLAYVTADSAPAVLAANVALVVVFICRAFIDYMLARRS